MRQAGTVRLMKWWITLGNANHGTSAGGATTKVGKIDRAGSFGIILPGREYEDKERYDKMKRVIRESGDQDLDIRGSGEYKMPTGFERLRIWKEFKRCLREGKKT